MPLINVIFILVVIGVVLWLINTYVTIMDARIKKILNYAVIIGVILWLLKIFGVFSYLSSIRV
jgi:hypothetical protein